MSAKKGRNEAAFDPFQYEEENFDYPSDRLTFRQLRLLWPDADALGQVITQVRFLENLYAMVAAKDVLEAAWSGEPPPDPKQITVLRKSQRESRQYLKGFYVRTGLAAGEHAAELLIRDVEARARNQYRPRSH